MVWAPDITIANIRAECAVITVGLKPDLVVTAGIEGGKAYVESVLRAAGYDVTNPADDLSIRDATIAYVVGRLLSSIYGSEQWNDEVAGAARGFWSRVRMFVNADGTLVGIPNLALVAQVLPTVHGMPISDGEGVTQFDVDSAHPHKFPLKVDDDEYEP